MKTKTLIAAMLLAAVVAGADTITPRQRIVLASNAPVVLTATATNDLNSALQRGLFEEEGNRDYAAAIANYQSLVAQFDQHHQLAATAIFRLGECYRKLGKTNEAVAQYERIVREFSDQQTLATLSRQNIAGLGSAAQTSAASANETLLASDDEEKEIRRIQTMIQNSPDLINSTAHGVTPLMQATSSGQIRVVGFLLAHGANINLKSGGEAPLHGATKSGNKAMVELLLNRGADVNATDGTGGTALHLAVESGFRSIAEVLVAHQANPNARNAPINGERTPLHRAAALGHVEMIKFLVAHGADVNARSNKGSTPLDSAVGPSQLDAVKTLLAAGAKPDLADNQGITPLGGAARGGNVAIAQALLDAKADPDAGKLDAPLCVAVLSGNTNLVGLLLRAGADPNKPGIISTGGNGLMPPLGFAIESGQPASAKLLFEAKANPNARDARDQSLLLWATCRPEVLKVMLDAGADPNVTDQGGETPLLYVVENRWQQKEPKITAARPLLEHGAKVNIRRPSDGASPLHLAAATEELKLVELLLDNKADVNAQDNTKATPLDWAKRIMPLPPANAARLAIIELLRQHGALEDLPDFSSIRITREGRAQSDIVFSKDASSVNRFTLLEVIRNFYRRASDSRGMPFPDFSKIIIQRPVPAKPGERKEITANLLTETNSFDCAKDQWLEFGDVIEIPEREHTLAEQAIGITEEQSKDLSHCLEGKVTFVVRGQKAEMKLDGSGYTGWLQLSLDRVRTLLRSSSDLSHIKITRNDPATRTTKEIIGDSKAKQSDNIWLRDGDVIEVPDK